jgi:hypothetical protein
MLDGRGSLRREHTMSSWFESDWGRESRQNRTLDELRDELSYASGQTSHLRSKLAQVTGSLEARVNRLANAFDAFVELSDLRQELIVYAGAAEVRQHAGRVLAALAAGQVPPAEPPDVPGYWLHPAVSAVQELAAGGDATKALTQATERDDRRTAVFLCLALVALGRRNEIRAEWVEAAFGQPAADGSVTGLQRTLWLAAAQGGLGDAGAQVVSDRLRVLTEPAEGEGETRSWVGLIATPGGTADGVLKDARVDAQVSAAGQLSRLRAAVERITGDQAIREPAASVLRADEALGGEQQPEGSGVVEMLRLHIGDGSEPERELLARVAVLRAKLNDTTQGPVSAEEPAGQATELIADDLQGQGGPHLAAFALRLVGPALGSAAEALHDGAVAEPPAGVTVRAEGQDLEIAPDGPRSLAEAEAKLRATGQPVASKEFRGAVAIAVVALVAGAGLAFVHWFWCVVGLAVAAFAARAAWRERARRVEEQNDLEQRVAKLRSTAAAATEKLASHRDGQAERVRIANEDLDMVRAQLTAR